MELNGKRINITSLEIEYDHSDAPDFMDSYVSFAKYSDGTELTDDEKSELTDKYKGWICQYCRELSPFI